MEVSFSRPNEEIDRLIDRLFELTGGIHHPKIIREMVLSSLKLGQEIDYLADLKLVNRTLREMRYTAKVFGPYRHKKKVTIFGSARTAPDEEMYQKCVRFSRMLVEKGYMIITGGGPGIMQAGNEGAGCEESFAVNIRLPFEQAPNPVMLRNPRLITYKYFFNRKVAFVKEADAVAVFPGGFGTLDEAMEVFTLVQTGKTSPKPLILVDDQEGYWERFFEFVKQSLLVKGFISGEDFSIFTITKDEQEAAEVIETFYRVYHSLRFIDHRLVIRLNKELLPEQIVTLEEEFPELIREGERIFPCNAFPEEIDEPDLAHLPRLSLHFDHHHYGLLLAFIHRINTF
ncbi:TIGR00730 family Rossman fold protein [Geobacter sp. SVR]|uniref:LOG family protein n=1 Tax=Geobacter sp. SVR TaxID=2495594 RepID=UPI00143EFC45|nr:TIGR00730 family Rossman fold protein [Geobacter sp. SVR]BCS55450.1 Rossman fold protein, TIGR00730 family [Geobacter sp. SVR]GCF83453.1 Rossman fold protein, TIGR00730 family [Geobacter sp. SVR]